MIITFGMKNTGQSLSTSKPTPTIGTTIESTATRALCVHAMSKDIVEKCADRDVGTIAVDYPKDIRTDQEWEQHGSKRLQDWAFETLPSHIEYKAEERGIKIEQVDEAGLKTSKTCCGSGKEAESSPVEREL